MTKDQLFTYIKQHKLAVLSYLGPNGTPQSALVGIGVTPELEIVFDSVKTSRKYPGLIANPAAAFVIGCTGDETVQYEGIAREISGPELPRYKAIYFTGWPDGPSREAWPQICYFVVQPKWIRFSDYGDTPTLIEEFKF
jgi:hypothetical protein